MTTETTIEAPPLDTLQENPVEKPLLPRERHRLNEAKQQFKRFVDFLRNSINKLRGRGILLDEDLVDFAREVTNLNQLTQDTDDNLTMAEKEQIDTPLNPEHTESVETTLTTTQNAELHQKQNIEQPDQTELTEKTTEIPAEGRLLGKAPSKQEEPIEVSELTDSETVLRKLQQSIGSTKVRQMIFQKMQWNWEQARKRSPNSKETTDPTHLQGQIDGVLRGELGERLSHMLPLQECQTVFSTDPDITVLELKSFEQYNGSHSKQRTLAGVVEKSIKEEPMTVLRKAVIDSLTTDDHHPTQKEIDHELQRLQEEIVEGYSVAGPDTHAGILYGDSVIPDGVLLDAQGELVGLSEIKAYRPKEFELFLEALRQKKEEGTLTQPLAKVWVNKHSSFHLGMDLSQETRFIDHLRRVGEGQPEMGETMSIVLRFPQDIPDASLQEFGRMLTEPPLGFYRITIQKLPLTSAQLSSLSPEIVTKGLNEMKIKKLQMKQGREFNSAEMEALTMYSNTIPEA